MAAYACDSTLHNDGEYHVDPANPMVKYRYIKSWYPPGVTEFFAGGSTACLGLLPDGTLLKYVRDKEDSYALNGLRIEQSILLALGPHDRVVGYLGEHQHGLLLRRAVNGDVRSYLSKNGHDNIPLQLRQKWTIQATDALSFIHSKGVIHCDIHPNNFLLDEQFNIQICDFSGALFEGLDGGAMESTRFFLPRDWRDPPNVNSDLFALGSLMYYIMTGREPYEDLPDNEVTAKYERKEFPDVEALQCGSAIKGCWKGDFNSTDDVLQLLTRRMTS